MSRIAKKLIDIPSGVTVSAADGVVSVSGKLGELAYTLHKDAVVELKDGQVACRLADSNSKNMKMVGTTRALINNMIAGVSGGFQKKLQLVGVGYRAQVKGNTLNLTLGFSHPVNYDVPEHIKIECPSQTEITVTGIDKQVVGQVAADIRSFRPPEPYKGKGVRYADEIIVKKQAKKK